MKNTFLGKLLSSGVQAIAAQVLGGVFFLVIAAYLTKDEVGYMTWANGVAFTATMVLSFGLDQVVIRRIAASGASGWAASAYLFHAFIGSVITLIVLSGIVYLPGMSKYMSVVYLPLFFMSQGLIFIGNPLRQLLSARQLFLPYATVSVISNLAKIVIAFLLIADKQISITSVAYTLIGCAAFEFIALLGYLLRKEHFSFAFKKLAYFKLLKEATPQFIAVIFDAMLSRADVILVGLICLPAATAEYGFAYRIYEIAKLPISVVSPILLARFAPMLNFNSGLDEDKKDVLQKLLSIELFAAMLIPLVLDIIWSPLLDFFFKGKFGSTNELQFLILSIAIPIHFYINMLWTLGFAARKFKNISKIIAITSIVNVLLNLALIPIYGPVGAAVAYLVTTVLQGIAYHKMISKHLMDFSSRPLFILFFIGLMAYFAALYATEIVILRVVIAIVVYIGIAIALKQVKREHITIVKTFITK